MGYLITQILIFLFLAALVGFLLAWALRGARLGAQIDALENELWAFRHGGGGDDAEVLRLRRELDEARRACREAEQEVEALRNPPRGQRVTPARAQAGVSRAPARTASMSAAADDLKRIKGIGPKIERTLNDLGVQRFSQIAAWTPEDVARISGSLRFSGRIERENWVAQARGFSEDA